MTEEQQAPVKGRKPSLPLYVRIGLLEYIKDNPVPTSDALTNLANMYNVPPKSIYRYLYDFQRRSIYAKPPVRFSLKQIAVLEAHFAKEAYPSKATVTMLAEEFGVPVKKIRCWYAKQRYHARKLG